MRLAACIPGFLVGGLNLVQGAFRIPQCSAEGWLEIRADQTAADVTCTDLGESSTVQWQLVKRGNNMNVTCNATGQCINPSNEIRATRADRGPTSDLYINSNHRTLAGDGVVKCWNPTVTSSAAFCKTNVISPAVLTHCKLSMTTGGTVAGTCHFTNAYSSNGTYSCIWTLTPSDGQGDLNAIITDTTHKTSYTSSSETYYRGTCFFTSSWLPAGQYDYTVRFLPGGQYQGIQTVTVPPPTPATTSTTSTSQSTAPPPTNTTTTTSLTSTSQSAADQSSSTEAYIAGGVVAAVVVIVAVVVVVVLVRRYLGRRLYDRPRRRRQLQRQPEENPYTGLDVYESVGQPAPVTPPTPDTAQSVYEIPDQDQETVPGVKISQRNTAFTSDIGDGYSTCVESQPYENDSRTDSSLPYRNDSIPGSSHPYKNDYQSGTSSQPYENDHQACDANHPYKNENPPDSSQPYENVSLSDPSKPAD